MRALRATVTEALERPLTPYYVLIGATGLLLTIGLIMVLSASSVEAFAQDHDSYAIVKRQLVWVLIGLVLAWVASRVPLRVVRGLAWPGYLVALVLLGLVVFLGDTRNGNQNWLPLGPLAVQPSEFAKLGLILWAGNVYALKERRLGRVHDIMVPVVPGMLLATGLVIVGNDLGTALILFAILLGMLWVVGAPARIFGFALTVISVVAIALAAFSDERLARLMNFADPFKDFTGAGWQPAHGLYALATGGVLGQGIGASAQKWGGLYAAHNDFIFAVLGEEVGLVGTLLVVGLYLAIAWAAVRVATRTEDPFVRYFTFGVVTWLIGQTMINIGMVLAWLPVIGVPLPLVSYGGSAMLPVLVSIGLVVGFARRDPEAALALAQQRRGRSVGLATAEPPRPTHPAGL